MTDSHFHVYMGTFGGPPINCATYTTYEDSVRSFAGLASQLYRHMSHPQNLQFVKAMEATEFGGARIAAIGPPSLALFWLRCEMENCRNPQMN